MRMGAVGFIVSFEDFGDLERCHNQRLRGLVQDGPLHPIQFSEIVARAFYVGGLNGYDFKFNSIEGPRDVRLALTPRSKAGRPVDRAREAEMVGRFTGQLQLGKLLPSGSATCLLDKSGNFQELPLQDDVLYPM